MKKIKKILLGLILGLCIINVNEAFAADESMVILNATNSTCNIYAKPDGKQALTYITPNYGRDAALIKQQGNWYKIAISGVVGWMQKGNCIGTGVSSVKKISTVSKTTRKSNGIGLTGLNVTRYQVVGNKMYLSIPFGANYSPTQIGYTDVPSGLKNNTVYYSHDGVNYYTNYNTMVADIRANKTTNAANKTPYYNYYQYVPIRSTTKIGAATFNSMLLKQRTDAGVKHKETKTLYQSCNGTKNFTNTYDYYKSAVYNRGNIFTSRQATYKVNAGALYGIMLNESAYGTSQLAYHYNNLFGWGAVDSCPASAKRFANIDASILEYYKSISESYANPADWRGGMGIHLGNKKSGANVKYASDPYWGYKNAYNYRILDEMAKNVDKNTHKLGIVNSGANAVDGTVANEYTKVYSSASTSSSSPFYYERNGASVIITGESGNFYRIQNDSKPNGGSVYIPKSKVKVISNDKAAAITTVSYSKTGNTHYIWGLNNEGQLGNGNTTSTNTKVNLNSVIPAGEVIKSVIVHKNKNVFVLTNAGNVYTSGNNSYGQRSYTSVKNKFNKVNTLGAKINAIYVSDFRLRMQKVDDKAVYMYVGKNGLNYINNTWNRTTAYPVSVKYNKLGKPTFAVSYLYATSRVQGDYSYNNNKQMYQKNLYTYDNKKNVNKKIYYRYHANKKINYTYTTIYNNNKITSFYEHFYVNGVMKSTKNQTAYRYQTIYNANQKPIKTYRVIYSTSGKLGSNVVVALRK